MANTKITNLTSLTAAAGDEIPVNRAGADGKITVADILKISGGTVTASAPVIDLTQTWNNAGVTFTGLELNVTNTASASASLLLDLQVDGSSKVSVRRDGKVVSKSSLNAGSSGGEPTCTMAQEGNGIFAAGSTGAFTFASTAAATATADVILARDAANTLALRNSTNAQTFNIYNTADGSPGSNYEVGFVRWAGNVLQIGAGKGGTGTARHLALTTDFTSRWQVRSDGHLFASADNTYDIGASGATRPRSLYLGTSLFMPSGGVINFNAGDVTLTHAAGKLACNGIFALGTDLSNYTGFHADPNLYFYANGTTARMQLSNTSQLKLTSSFLLGWTSSAVTDSLDTFLRRSAAANLALGNVDAASPVAQTLSVQNVVAGTSDTAGADFTIKGSAGTGSGNGGNIYFSVATAGSSGSSQNSFATGMVLTSSADLYITSNVSVGAAAQMIFASRARLQSPADGVLFLRNAAGNDFGRLQFGGTTSSFPALKRSLNEIMVRLADDSANTRIIAGSIRFDATGTPTIASGVIAATAANTIYKIDTESAAASDDLDTITAEGADGQIIILRAAHTDRTVVVKDGTGNIQIAGDMTLDNTQDTITLFYDSGLSVWLEIGRAASGA